MIMPKSHINYLGPAMLLHPSGPEGPWTWKDRETEDSLRTTSWKALDFSADALITALSCLKNGLANLGTELNNLWHNLNI